MEPKARCAIHGTGFDETFLKSFGAIQKKAVAKPLSSERDNGFRVQTKETAYRWFAISDACVRLKGGDC